MLPNPVQLDDLNPSKIIAVHLNYQGRASERGRVPGEPSYFLKPPSSLARGGGPVARPAGSEYLNYEGEIAVVIGAPRAPGGRRGGGRRHRLDQLRPTTSASTTCAGPTAAPT